MAEEVSGDDAGGDSAHDDAGGARQDGLHVRLTRLEQHLGLNQRSLHALENQLQPVWRRISRGEPRLAATLSIMAIIGLQVALPDTVSAGPRWVVPILEGVLLIALVIANPRRLKRQSPVLRAASIGLIAVTSAANAWSAAI